ncbi:MAG: ABC transporter permease [Chitinivibrionales bacterium]
MRKTAQRIAAITRKETWHVLRDPQALTIVLLLPAVMMFLYGYALNTEISDIAVGVSYELDDPALQHIISSLNASDLFEVTTVVGAVDDPVKLFQTKRIRALFRFSPTFSADMQTPAKQGEVQVLIDGSDPNLGTIVRNAARQALSQPTLKYLNIDLAEPVKVKQSILYNPHQKSAVYFVPGLMVIILTMISALLTSVALTKEKENGTLDQLAISPLKPHEIVIGKLIPYLGLAAIDGFLVLVIGRFAFGVSIKGNALLLGLVSVFYIIICLLLGLLISTITRKQLHAMFLTILATMMPSVILTGFIFPVRSMPAFLQGISAVLPATHYLTIIRAIMLKAVGVSAFRHQLAVLGVMFLVVFTLSIIRVRKTL